MRIPSLAVTLILGAPGFIMQMYGLVNGQFFWGVAGSLLLSAGLARFIANKGYHPAWGLWGFAPIMGILLLMIQWPREELEKVGVVSAQKDPGAVLGGRTLLAVMAPVGVAIMFLSSLFLGDAGEWLRAAVASISSSGGDADAKDSSEEAKAAEEDQAKDDSASKADETQPDAKQESESPKKDGPAPIKEGWPERVRNGMSFNEVTKLAGAEGETVAGGPYGNRIVRWKAEGGRDVLVRFHNDIVERTSASAPDSEDGKKPQAEIDDAVAQVLDKPDSEEASPDSGEPKASKRADAAPRKSKTTSEAEKPETTAPTDEAAPQKSEASEAEERPRPKVVRVDNPPGPAARSTFKKPVFPEYSDAIPVGPHEIILHNPGSSELRAAVRLGRKGKDLTVPAHGARSVHVFNGRYEVYFMKSEAPDRLGQVGAVDVQSPPDGVHVQLEEPVSPVKRPEVPKLPR